MLFNSFLLVLLLVLLLLLLLLLLIIIIIIHYCYYYYYSLLLSLLLLLLLLFINVIIIIIVVIIISVSFYLFNSAFPFVWLIITRDRPDNLYLAMLFPLNAVIFNKTSIPHKFLWIVAFQFFKIWLRTYHSDILVSTVKVLHFTKTDFNWVLSYVFNPNESSIILFTSPQVLWRHKDYWRLGKLALKKKQ